SPAPWGLALRMWTVVAMIAGSVGTTLWILPRIDRIRDATPGPLAALADSDSRKVEFNRLHGLSNGLMLRTTLGGRGVQRAARPVERPDAARSRRRTRAHLVRDTGSPVMPASALATHLAR